MKKPRKKTKDIVGYRVTPRLTGKVHEVDFGQGYVVVSEAAFNRLTRPLIARVRKAKKALDAASVVVVPSEGRLGRRVRPVGKGHAWPMKSDALAVHPSQIAEAEARNKRHGVNVQYEPHAGLAIIPDGGEYKKLLRLERRHHNNSYN